MFKKILLAAAAAAFLVPAGQAAAEGFRGRSDRYARSMAASRTWHGDYYHTMTGYPIPMVVPPTANMETRWGWGVGQSTMTPIYHQFQRPHNGGGVMGNFRATPMHRSHTDQFGTYYIRGPW